VVDRIESGDLLPLMQISSERISDHPALDGVPLLGGDGGVAARRAAETGGNVEEAVADAEALIGLISAGRLVVAPLSIEPELRRCLEDALVAALHDPAFRDAAGRAKRSLDVADGATALAAILSVAGKAEGLAGIYKNAVEKARR
jgi:hypothetical protein